MESRTRNFHGGRRVNHSVIADSGDGNRYKHCYVCNEDLITDKFYPDVSQHDGISSRCVECDLEKKKQYYSPSKTNASGPGLKGV